MENETPHKPVQPFKQLTCWILLGILFVLALALRYQGLDWPRLHPDREKMHRWIAWTSTHASVEEQAYPSGFFTLLRPVRKVVLAKHLVQERWNYFLGRTDQFDRERVEESIDNIMLARHFNAWLGSLSVLLIFLFTRRITGSPWLGLGSAALMTFAGYHIEHCHYAETDAAMVFVLSLAMWLWACVGSSRKLWQYVIASLASGFAAGTKYPLVLLMIPMLLYALELGRAPERSVQATVWHMSRLVLLGLFLFAVGFAWANPQVLNIRQYAADFNRFSEGVFLEFGAFAISDTNPFWDRIWTHACQLGGYAESLGWGWLVLALAGFIITCLLYRQHLPIFAIMPLLVLYALVFHAPWLRSQEFLILLPFLAGLAAIPLNGVSANAGARVRMTVRAIAVPLFLFAIAGNTVNGLERAGLFAWKDSRIQAQEWMLRHAPYDHIVGAENYARAACYDTYQSVVRIQKIEDTGMERINTLKADFLFRNVTFSGRNIFDVRGIRRAEAAENFRDFEQAFQLLRTWSPGSPESMLTFSFVNPEIQLWARKPAAEEMHLALYPAQPLWLNQKGRGTLCPVGWHLGGEIGFEVDRQLRTFSVGGPRGDHPPYLILNTEERPAVVRVHGPGILRKETLPPYHTRVIELRPPRFYPLRHPYFKVSVKAVTPPYIDRIPCYARIAVDPWQAARICAKLDAHRQGWSWIQSLEPLNEGQVIEQYTQAVQVEDRDRAAALEKRAEDALLRIAEARAQDARAINRTSGTHVDTFSRLRLQLPGEQQVVRIVETKFPARQNPDGRFPVRGRLILPVRIAQGSYTLSLSLQPQDIRPTTEMAIVTTRGDVLARISSERLPGKSPVNIDLKLNVDREQTVLLCLVANHAMSVEISDLELRWRLDDILTAEHARLVAARADHLTQLGRFAEAAELLRNAEPPPYLSAQWAQLNFEAARGIPENREQLTEAAEALLEYSPIQAAARAVLQPDQAPVASVPAPLEAPFRFEPFVDLLGLEFDPENRTVRCHFVAAENEVPPLLAGLAVKKKDRWIVRKRDRIFPHPGALEGDESVISLDVNKKNVNMDDPGKLAICVYANTEWEPGRLRVLVDGAGADVLPISQCLKAGAPK